MNLRSAAFQKLWLKVSAFIIFLAAPVFFLASMEASSGLARYSLQLVSFRTHSFDANTTRFLSALAGGYLLGWSITVWCLQELVYDKCPDGVRRSVIYGTFAWYLLDSLGSALSGNPVNVLFNTAFLLLIVAPLRNCVTQVDGTVSQPLVSTS